MPCLATLYRFRQRDGFCRRELALLAARVRRATAARRRTASQVRVSPQFLVLFALLATSHIHTVEAQNSEQNRRLDDRRIDTEPFLVIGDESSEEKRFERIAGVTRLASGEIVVLDGASQDLRVFSPKGDFLRRIGRRGAGPGELENATSLFRVLDSLFVVEQPPAQSRLNLFHAREGFRRRWPLRASNAFDGSGAVARLSSGDLLVVPAGFRPFVPPPFGTVVRDSTRIGILHQGNPGEVKWIGVWPSASWLSYALSSGPVRVAAARYSLGPALVVGSSADGIWIGDSGDGIIHRYDGAGMHLGASTLPIGRRRFTKSALSRRRVEALAAASGSDEKARIEADHAIETKSRLAPAFSRFVPGPDREMWVVLFNEDTKSTTTAFVLDARGVAVATAVVPARVRVYEVGRDYLVGVHTDDDGIESVVVYALGANVR
ncbi:MAG: hypothetical protein IT359_06940 [Gemmatimonadaceae bacterium]|nr:hypothetical protein [Gemmatimonadaceae bacterium]